MPNTPISLTVPAECPNCHALMTVHFVTVYEGLEVIMRWRCRACIHEWPVTRQEPHPAPDAIE